VKERTNGRFLAKAHGYVDKGHKKGIGSNDRGAEREKGERIISHRMTAVIVGVLFIAATVASFPIGILLGSTLEAPNYLADVAANDTRVIMAVIFELILAVSVFGIGFMLFPILRRHSESVALGYAGIRLIEAVFIVVASLGLLSLLTLSRQYVAGTLDASYYQTVGASLLALRDWSYLFGTLIFLGLGALALNYLLYRSRLVPRWLSAWGLIGAALVLLYGLLGLFGLGTGLTSPSTLLALPIALREMVFAVWLIVKGFDKAATDSGFDLRIQTRDGEVEISEGGRLAGRSEQATRKDDYMARK
jgi:hypothetical protein